MNIDIGSLSVQQLFSAGSTLLFLKWAFVFVCFVYILFLLVIFSQIRAMEKIITQPLSSAILGLVSLLLIGSSVGLLILVIRLP